MNVVLLGTGNGKADPARFAPSNVVWVGDEPVLVDCGNGALLRLREAGIAPGSVRRVFLTHLHFDHYSDLPYLAIEPIMGEAAYSRGKLEIYGPPGTERLVRTLELAYDIEMDSYAGLEGQGHVRDLVRSTVVEFHDGWQMEIGGTRVTVRMVDHGIVKLPCFAFRFDGPAGESVVFSGDTVPCDALIGLAEDVDMLVHECNFPDEEVETRKRLGYVWYIHSTPSGVAEVARRSQPKTLVLNHLVGWNDFSPGREPYDWEEIAPPVISTGFEGTLIVGHDLLQLRT